MKTGKVSESVLKRSVLRQLKTKRDEVLCGAAPGTDCAILAPFSGEALLSTASVTVSGQDAAVYGIHNAVNNLAVSGGEATAVWLNVLLPTDCEESELKALMAQAEKVCAGLHIQIAGGHTEVTDAVNRIILSVTAVGQPVIRGESAAGLAGEKQLTPGKAQPGMDLIVTKWIGMEGTSLAAKLAEEHLLSRFPAYLVDEAKAFDRYLSIIPEAAVAVKSGAWAMTDASRGGIFAALWKLAERSGVGLEIELRKLPIRQETVEICNFLDLNPYELASGGSVLIAAENGNDLVRELENAGTPAVLVGRTTDSNDRVIFNGEEKRFLEPAKPDEILKIRKEYLS